VAWFGCKLKVASAQSVGNTSHVQYVEPQDDHKFLRSPWVTHHTYSTWNRTMTTSFTSRYLRNVSTSDICVCLVISI